MVLDSWKDYLSRRRLYRVPAFLRSIRISVDRAWEVFNSEGDVSRDPGEWLLDNYYVVQRALGQVEHDLSFSFHRELPLNDRASDSLDPTRISGLCRDLTTPPASILNISGAISALRRFLRTDDLTSGELWAFPVMLRLAVLQNLAGELDSLVAGEGDGEGVSSAILNLRKIDETDWKSFFELVSPVERILREDPSGIYPEMDFDTRDSYRKRIERLSRTSGRAERKIAEMVIETARGGEPGSVEAHCGWYLLTDPGRRALGQAAGLPEESGTFSSQRILIIMALGALLAGGLFALPAVLISMGRGLSWTLPAAVLTLPAAAMGITAVFEAVLRFGRTAKLPKMDFSEGIPREARTIVVVPAILSSPDQADDLTAQLEHHYLSNGGSNVLFALLTDLHDSTSPESPGEESIIQALETGISSLNSRYSSQDSPLFFLFHRKRLWNPLERKWMGWERKRGKIEEFNRLLLGSSNTSFMECRPPGDIEYVVTLDSDTVLPGGAVAVMAGAMAHPLNRYDGRSGYTVLQPRTIPLFGDGEPSRFFRSFSGDFSVDLYSNATSDVYQDLFGQGIYMGKGIYDLRSFHSTAGKGVPENSLLSHDLLEGLLGRAGYLSDVVVYEEFPRDFSQWMMRLHRWIRGDWQLLPWLFKGGFSPLDRWKMADNIRRSLTAPALMALLLTGWFTEGGAAAGVLTVAAAAVIFRKQLMETLFHGPWIGWNSWLRGILETVYLPATAACSLHASVVTLFRMFVSRRNLLMWTCAAAVREKAFPFELPTLLFAVMLPATAAVLGAQPAAAAAPFLALWISAPLWSRLSRGREGSAQRKGAKDEFRDELMCTALRTWHFFDVFCGPEDHWLPPDHFQEEPLGEVAHRTSPTNVGLFLLSVLSAAEMGFIGIRKLLLRIEDTLAGMSRLSRYRGHILNWHSTRTLEPLHPRYVSTVDSGNLLAALITLGRGLKDAPGLSPLSMERWDGLRVRILMLIDALRRIPECAGELILELERVQKLMEKAADQNDRGMELLSGLCFEQLNRIDGVFLDLIQGCGSDLTGGDMEELRTWSDMIRSHLASMLDEIQFLYPWMLRIHSREAAEMDRLDDQLVRSAWKKIREGLPVQPSPGGMRSSGGRILDEISALSQMVQRRMPGVRGERLAEWCGRLGDDVGESMEECEKLLDSLAVMDGMIESEIRGMDFSFLYHQRRKVFRIGFNVDSERPDANCYDLLASEARIASLLAIAARDVPFDHWMHLSRPFASLSGNVCLLSWSGTMFEYLMPTLFTGYRRGTLLGDSCLAAVKRQESYCAEKGLPWGISESGYYRFDQGRHYQYMAFGVPGLGFRRGLEDDLVITPYASLLALPVDLEAVMKNLERIRELGGMGHYGLYESLDLTPGRLPAGEKYAVVRSYMAHHQGMILLAIMNHLKDGRIAELFMGDPKLRTVEVLLRETSPGCPGIIRAGPRSPGGASRTRVSSRLEGWRGGGRISATEVHHLSNGAFGAVVSHRGRTWMSWKGRDLNSRESPGATVFLKDMETGRVSDSCSGAIATWYPHRVELMGRRGDITVHTEMTVSPNSRLFLRRVSLTSHSPVTRRLFLCLAMEPVLAEPSASTSHPEFNRLFLSTFRVDDPVAVVVSRRRRHPEEEGMAAGLMVIGGKNASYDTDRETFLGRGGCWERPRALLADGGLSERMGTSVDPLLAAGAELIIAPEESAAVTFAVICGSEPSDVLDTARDIRGADWVETVFQQAEVFAGRELDVSGVNSELLRRMQPVLSSLLFPSWRLRADPSILERNMLSQKYLWRFGISGDFPVLLVSANTDDRLDLLGELLRIYRFWRSRGLMLDLVILNREHTGYENELQGRIHRLLSSTGSDDWIGRKAGIALVSLGLISDDELVLLQSWASVALSCSESLEEQIIDFRRERTRQPSLVPVPVEEPEPLPSLVLPNRIVHGNGYGGFTEDGREYVILLDRNQWLPRPWINVMAGEKAGMTVSESGVQCLWAENSGEYRLIPWRNDPLLDTPGLAVYLRDQETGEYWSPSPLPARDGESYLVRHSVGLTSWEHNSRGLRQTMTAFAVPDQAASVVKVSIENPGVRNRRIGVTLYTEPVLGRDRRRTSPFLITTFHTGKNALLTRNTAGETPPSGVFFIASSRTPSGITCDRDEFLGTGGSMGEPAALIRTGLSGNLRPGMDPCCAMQVMTWIGPGETKEVTFLLGHGENTVRAVEMIDALMSEATGGELLARVREYWDLLLEGIQVETPNPGMDMMVNRWLLYQTISCRMLGRTALYQSSGAYGFRDQLQDSIAFCGASPGMTREHLLRCAGKQFTHGDVLHWWHPPVNAGVRTRCSDDLLWLPWAVAEYVERTGDTGILSEEIPYLSGDPLGEQECERYDAFKVSSMTDTLHRHCLKALEKGSTRGRHGLPLMGSHDWNDGMNLVGAGGRGESVWLGWFLLHVLEAYGKLCSGGERIELKKQADELKNSLRESAWDGGWYLRGFYDNGQPLGSSQNDECMIDSIAQTWAVISGGGDRERNVQAMRSVEEHLIRRDEGLVLLFTPPFDKTSMHPGYIMGYPPGVRENGGQYTHAAVWAGWAYSLMRRGDDAVKIFDMLNPLKKSIRAVETYRVEPYAVAADVYSSPECTGRGGWTWYTGAAGWLYRLAVEAILGISIRDGRFLDLSPCVPRSWNRWKVTLRHHGSLWRLNFTRNDELPTGEVRIYVNGNMLPGYRLELTKSASENTVAVQVGVSGSP